MEISYKLPTKRRMHVKITESAGWYKKGEIHEVGCYMAFSYLPKGSVHYEKRKHGYGIDVTHCKVIKILN